MDIVGVIPAAGKGTRLGVPFSKELFPLYSEGGRKVTPVIEFLLERMKIAGIRRAYVITNKEKLDLLYHLGNGAKYNLEICYLLQENARGMPDAINLITNWISSNTIVLFGMPDTVFFPTDALKRIVDTLLSSQVDVVLGLFPTDEPKHFGMVSFDKNFRPLKFIDKPDSSDLKYLWGIACWKYKFMEILNYYVQVNTHPAKELVLSDIFEFALNQNLNMKVYPFQDGKYFDIGVGSEIYRIITLINNIT